MIALGNNLIKAAYLGNTPLKDIRLGAKSLLFTEFSFDRPELVDLNASYAMAPENSADKTQYKIEKLDTNFFAVPAVCTRLMLTSVELYWIGGQTAEDIRMLTPHTGRTSLSSDFTGQASYSNIINLSVNLPMYTFSNVTGYAENYTGYITIGYSAAFLDDNYLRWNSNTISCWLPNDISNPVKVFTNVTPIAAGTNAAWEGWELNHYYRAYYTPSLGESFTLTLPILWQITGGAYGGCTTVIKNSAGVEISALKFSHYPPDSYTLAVNADF